MNGIKTNRNELISDFNPFGLDKLVMELSPNFGDGRAGQAAAVAG
jgi:hypothetical protein